MKNICFVRYDITEKSGADRVAVILANELSAFFNLHLFSICGEGQQPFYHIDPSVQYYAALPGHDRIRNTAMGGCKALRRYVKAHQIDVLLAVGGIAIPFVWQASLGTGVKTVFCEHINLSAVSDEMSNRLFRKIAAKCFDKIITLTRRDCEAYKRRYHLYREEKVEYIYNWVEDDILSRNARYCPDAKKIITVGRVSEEKGYDMLVKAAKPVFVKHPDWRWDIYGDGPQMEEIKGLIRANGLEQHVFLMGTTDRIYDRYPQYAFYVMTSRVEGLPLVLLEAKANNLPIISFDCMTGPAEIVTDQVDGFLVPPEDTEMLSERICQLMEDAQLRQSFANQAKNNIHLFDKKTIVNQWVQMLNTLAQT